MPVKPSRCDLPEWKALTADAAARAGTSIRALFAADPNRAENLTFSAAGLSLDLSKNHLAPESLGLLLKLGEACDLQSQRAKMAAGESINTSENRAVLHMALRGTSNNAEANGLAADMRERLCAYAEDIRAGRVLSATGKPFRHVVNIGIGGSDLGPRLVVDALRDGAPSALRSSFVSNVDGADLSRALADTIAEETLFVIASKTFTTQETMRNAQSARDWLVQQLPKGADIGRHIVAVTTNDDAAIKFGVDQAAIFGFWDWVGGRFSLWSSVGISIAIALGAEAFNELLDGAAEMDRHFLDAPLDQNLPILLALVGIWNRNFLNLQSHAILPYATALEHLPLFLQQLEMESNGKQVTRDGEPVSTSTAPIIWGASGTNGQHAFFQWLHQGTDVASADIILPLRAPSAFPGHHDILLAHGIAQGEAFAFGRDSAETRAALKADGMDERQIDQALATRTFTGNRPITTIVMDALAPRALGALLALYEHKVFCQGAIWDINSFDQWGVELGKALAGRVLDALQSGGDLSGFDPSTRKLIQRASSTS